MNKTENTLHKKTPSVTVLSNRGQVVRDIVYHRHPDTPEKTDERITCHQFDSRGFLEKSADPRMQASGLSNFRYITSLSGQVLRTESADAGTSLTLNDAAGRPVISISQIRTDNGQDDRSLAVTQTFQYEGADSAGRPLSIAEQTAGQSAVVTERFVYAGNSEADKAKNLAGVCTHHYDPAGLMQTDSIALTGVPLSVTRQFLKDADNPVNWPESNPESLLSAEKYTTQTTADATGAVLNTTDAAGHQQKVTYDIAGLLNTSRVTVKDGAEKTIIKSVTYSAAGQKLREEHGNGVVTTYTYEAQTQRLIAVKTEHPARKKIFQDLRYEYDPVGNVLCVTNDAEETRFWHNQKVVPENRYTYDSLYQLVSATGREMASAGQQSGFLPDISPFDKASYTNYTRNYVYDRAGNMTQIRHSAPATGNNYTTDITVSQRSNRAVLKTLADTPEKAEALFTPGGQQTQLQPGQTLSWTTRGELQQVTPVVRNGAAGDRESYRYDAGSQRILKIAVQKTGNSTQTQQVIYLPGLELRSGKENYQVICAGVAGRAQVRLLHWPDGKKDHQRFSYDNLIGSSGLEIDGDGKLLSQEEYYPFGGTAVLVADTVSGIDYKTHRYSGKERDATGLYYYGYRYYQPWAGRWLSSDPAGTIDGLNLFRMVRNNPVSMKDEDGRVAEWLDLAYPRERNNMVEQIYKENAVVKMHHIKFTAETKKILDETEKNEFSLKGLKPNVKEKKMRGMKYTNAKLKSYAAHAGFLSLSEKREPVFKSGFINFTGSLSNKNTFPGVHLIDEKVKAGFEAFSPALLKTTKKWRPEVSLGYYRIEDTNAFVSEIKNRYSESGTPLTDVVESRIREHIKNNNNILPKMAGIAGLHAEVQALNFVVSSMEKGESVAGKLSESYIYTQRLVGAKNEDFPACHNCSGIISGLENVMTGRVKNHIRLTRRNSVS